MSNYRIDEEEKKCSREENALAKKRASKAKVKGKEEDEEEEEELKEKKKNWPDSDIEQLITLQAEMHLEFEKNAKKKVRSEFIKELKK